MKQLKEISLPVVVGLFLTTLLVYWVRGRFVLQQEKIQAVASQSFLKAIDKEVIKSKNALKYFNYNFANPSDTIPTAEKMDWCDQSYLIDHDPNRLTLDSLFQAELAKQHLDAPTAVRCLFEGKTVYSNSDSLFCQQAIALPLVVYRLNDLPIKRCELQGYIKLSVGTVLKQIPSIGFMVLFWALSVLFVFAYFYYNRKRREIRPINVLVADTRIDIPVETAVEDYIETPVQITVEDRIEIPVQTTVEWIKLPHDLYLCKASGILKCGEQQVSLSGNGLRLFRMFIKQNDYFLTFEDISCSVFGSKIDKDKSYDYNKIAVAIKRLRETLKKFTHVKIKTIRGKGYLLEIKPEHPSEPETLAPKEPLSDN